MLSLRLFILKIMETSLELFEQTVDAYNSEVSDIYKFSFTAKETEMFTEMMIEFAKIHVTEALKKAKENVSLKLSSSEEINDKNISPFITADDETIWIIDEKSISDSYSLDNVV